MSKFAECIFCTPSINYDQVPLAHIVQSLQVVLKLLENQTTKVNADHEQAAKLESEIETLRERNVSLEEEKKAAQDRSDTYKKRFLDAQEAIKALHEKNLSLSRSLNSSSHSEKRTESNNSFPFGFFTKKEGHHEPKKVILAPDTCAVNTTNDGDVTYISSDEDDFQIETKKTRSPRFSPRPSKSTSPRLRAVNDSFFTKPKSPVSSSKNRKIKPEATKPALDMDETRLDLHEPMEDTIVEPTNSVSLAEALGDTELLNMTKEFDSIPPSPVLSAGKQRRFGSLHGSRGGVPRFNLHGSKEDKEIESPSILPPKMPFRLSGKLPLMMSNSLSVEATKDSLDSESWQEGNPLKDSLPLHKLRTEQNRTPQKSKPANTSLDDLFDKTDGNLETTTMLGNTTWDGLDGSDDDEDLDALLLQSADEAEGSLESKHPRIVSGDRDENSPPERKFKSAPVGIDQLGHSSKIHKPLFHDSFDVVPKAKEKVTYKYQEVVRKRDERKKLDGKACAQCEAYYSDLTDEERKATLKDMCRHKHVNPPPSTPDHFWEVDIPDTQECKRRGYFVDHADLPTQVRKEQMPRLRRKKPLEYVNPKKR